MTPVKLRTTDTSLEGLLTVYHAKRRKNTRTLEVEPDALGQLIKDHLTLIQACRDAKVAIEEGRDQTSLRFEQ